METRNEWRNSLEKRLRELAAKGVASRETIEARLAALEPARFVARAVELRERAEATGQTVLARFEKLPERAFERMGLATRPQLEELAGQLQGLSRKLEKLARKRRDTPVTGASEAPAEERMV